MRKKGRRKDIEREGEIRERERGREGERERDREREREGERGREMEREGERGERDRGIVG